MTWVNLSYEAAKELYIRANQPDIRKDDIARLADSYLRSFEIIAALEQRVQELTLVVETLNADIKQLTATAVQL